MPYDSDQPDIEDFVKLAQSIGGLSGTEVRTLVELAKERRHVPTWQVALEQGKLHATDVDIIRTLLAPLDSIPGYQVLGMIGRGGMGVVYRARQLSLNRDVALKTILLSQLANATAAARFENEAQVLARVTHPHIVAAFDFGRHAERLFLAMELVQGEDVQALIERKGPLPESIVLHVIRQAASGLAHAARANIVHRDIKPANLLLISPPDGFPLPRGIPMVKVADFGLSVLGSEQQAGKLLGAERLTSDNVHVGSPTYMAPEQIEGGDIGHAADIFSLGITAWHMLVGHAPLQGSNLRQLLINRLTQPTPPITQHLTNCLPATSLLVENMLVIDPVKRINAYDELLHRIDAILPRLGSYDAYSFDRKTSADTSTQINAALDRTSLFTSGSPAQLLATSEFSANDTSQTTVKQPMRRTFALWLGLAPALLLGLLFAGWKTIAWMQTGVRTRQTATTGPRFALFDGVTLTDWTIVSGTWYPDLDAEGAAVLHGENGTIRRPLANVQFNEQSLPFVFEASYLVEAKATARLTLLGKTTKQDQLAIALELQPEAFLVTLWHLSESPRLVYNVPLLPTNGITPSARSIRLEWQQNRWWIVFDGQEVGSVASPPLEKLSAIELTAIEGSLNFADLSLAILSTDKPN